MSELLPNTIAELHAALRRGTVSLDHAIQIQVERFAQLSKVTHAVTRTFSVKPNLSYDTQLPLIGVGLAHKDIFDLKDRSPGVGRNRGRRSLGKESAPVIQALDAAGALNLGALAMAEDACSATGQTENLPTPINPLGSHLAVGGSSSGSGVAVACGAVYGSLGTDTAGSVRIPAMTCGVMSLKTTHGLINTKGMSALSPSLDSIGLLARSVDDLDTLFSVLRTTKIKPGVRPAPRVGYWLEGAMLDSDIRKVIEPVMLNYASAEVDLTKHVRRATLLQQVVMAYEIGQTHRRRIQRNQACAEVLDVGTFGLSIAPSWYCGALEQRSDCLNNFMDSVMSAHDVIIMPLQVSSLPSVDEVYRAGASFSAAKLLGLHRFCGWLNYMGLPALSLPVGTDEFGLPVSLQLIGRPFHETDLIEIGMRLQLDIYGKQGIMPKLNIESVGVNKP